MIYLDLLIGFLKVGMFAFGGAYAAIPFMREVVLSYGWLNDEALSYMIAVSESTPGPIMVNLATYVGYSQGGVPGAILATAAVILPAFVIIILIMVVLKNVLKSRYVQAALGGMKPCVAGIILATGAYMIITDCFLSESGITISPEPVIMTVLLAGIMLISKLVFKKKISPILLIVLAGILGNIV